MFRVVVNNSFRINGLRKAEKGVFNSFMDPENENAAEAPRKRGRPKGSRGPNKFNRREITRSCRAVEAAGLQVDRVEIDPNGKLSIVARNDKAAESDNQTDVDKWLSKHHATKR
jgi:hypothetical protein